MCVSDKIHSLLRLYRVITSVLNKDYDKTYTSKVMNRLFDLIIATKPLTQSGSDFNKNCLLCIGNLYCENEIKPKYLKVLSSLCGHDDFEIRCLSWNFLSLVAKSIDGAEAIITELSNLPGGIHACTITSIFDEKDVAIVRSSAATFFANLICHQNRKNGLHKRAIPRCKAVRIDTDRANPIEVLEEILERQSFFKLMSESLKYFMILDKLEQDVSSLLFI